MTNDIFNKKFEEIYLQPAQAISCTPGRVNLIGEFTDYNNGFVLPCALEFATRILFRKRDDNQIVVHSLHYPGEHDEFSLDGDIIHGDSQWGNYIRAVAFVFRRQGHQLCGVDLSIDSNIPQGSGLSSSAALEVAVGGVFNQLCQLNLSNQMIALLGQQAENDFIDCQCGIMDQLVSANGEKGHALLIDCQSLVTESICIPDGISIVIVNSNYPRKLVDSEYNQRRIDCERAADKMSVSSLRNANIDKLNTARSKMTNNEYKRAHHVITENIRVLNAVEALKHNDMQTLRELMSASHQSLKNDFEVTVLETDGLVDICQTALGNEGAVRMTGGGFGGAIVCLCPHRYIDEIKNAVDAHYYDRFNIHASIYVSKAGDGLRVSLLTTP